MHDLRRHEKQKHADLLRQGVIGPGITGIAPPGSDENTNTVQDTTEQIEDTNTDASATAQYALAKTTIASTSEIHRSPFYTYGDASNITSVIPVSAALLPGSITTPLEAKSVLVRHNISQSQQPPVTYATATVEKVATTIIPQMSLDQLAAITGYAAMPITHIAHNPTPVSQPVSTVSMTIAGTSADMEPRMQQQQEPDTGIHEEHAVRESWKREGSNTPQNA